MIRIIVGNVGSGKTALAVREMFHNVNKRNTYTNIQTQLPNTVEINAEMIMKQEIVDHKTNKKTGETIPIYKQTLNIDYWKAIKEPINVTLDEAHSIINARRSMSKTNIIITDWIALIRRILGENSTGYGTLTFITQLPKRIDSIAREMATQIIYCRMHYQMKCAECATYWTENTEMPETVQSCPRCNSIKLIKSHHTIEAWNFKNIDHYELWYEMNKQTFYKHYFIKDISKYFNLYNTLQWDNLFSTYH